MTTVEYIEVLELRIRNANMQVESLSIESTKLKERIKELEKELNERT